jgi:peptide-methionine (S)-S-oxide reductase
MMSENTETAILAGGCFWPAQELLRRRDGIVATRVGFLQIHRPDLGPELVGSDYRSEIFCTSQEQGQIARDTIADASGMWPGKVVTRISEAGVFWEAGAEDQNYLQFCPHGKNQFRP